MNHNQKLILGLIWSLIYRFYVPPAPVQSGLFAGDDDDDGDRCCVTEESAKQRLLVWIQEKIPSLNVRNFTSDWNSGIAIGALVDSLAPGIYGPYNNNMPSA